MDLSSLESIVRDVVKPGMSDSDKAVAVWRFMHFHTYGGVYPTEQFSWWGSCFDPVKALSLARWHTGLLTRGTRHHRTVGRVTAALLDRLTHHCEIFQMNGESYRFRESMKKKAEHKAK